jgi:hypothetical protein
MQEVKSLVSSGSSDEALSAALQSIGKASFCKQAARAFAKRRAARGDLDAAEVLLAICRDKARKAWCGSGALALARSLFSADDMVVISFEGEKKVLLSREVLSGDAGAAERGLSNMVAAGLVAEAVVHSRALEEGSSQGAVFSAMAKASPDPRSRRYVEVLSIIYAAAGSDGTARRMLVDAAVAHGGGWLPVAPPSSRDVDDSMRLAALYTASLGPARKKRPSKRAAAEYKTVTLEGPLAETLSRSEKVHLIKC